jgi:hypothetical protein
VACNNKQGTKWQAKAKPARAERRWWQLLQRNKEKAGAEDRIAYVEDEVLVLGLEREAAAEVDAPHQHHDCRRRGQRVRRVRERRRLHAQRGRGHHLALLLQPLSRRRWQCSLYLPAATSRSREHEVGE